MNPKKYRDLMNQWIDAYIRYDNAITYCMAKEYLNSLYGAKAFERRTIMEDKKETLQEKIDRFNKVYDQCTLNLGYGCPVRKTSACAQFRVKNADMRIIKAAFDRHTPALPRTMMSMAIDIATKAGINEKQPLAMIYICSEFWKLICEIQKELWAEQYEYRVEETEVDPLDKLLEEVLEIDQYCDFNSSETSIFSCPLRGRGGSCTDLEVDVELYRLAISAFRDNKPMPHDSRAMFEDVASGKRLDVCDRLFICRRYVKKILKLDDMLWANRIFQVPSRADEEACEPSTDDKEDTAGTDVGIAELMAKVRKFDRHCTGERFDPIHCPGNRDLGWDRCTAYCVSRKAYKRAIELLLDGKPMTHEVLVAFFGEYHPDPLDVDGAIYLCTPYYKTIKKLNDALLKKRYNEITPKKDVDVAVEKVRKALLAASEAIKNTLDEQ